MSNYKEKEPYGFYYGYERENQYLSTAFMVHHLGEAIVDSFYPDLVALGFIGATGGVCDGWRGFDLETANKILINYREKKVNND